MKKKLKALIVVLLFGVFLLLPILLIMQLSKKEMKQYNTNEVYFFKEASYGEPCVVVRQDMQQYYSVSGIVTSDTYHYMKVDDNSGNEIRLSKSIGDEIAKDEIIGYQGEKEITSIYNGIIEEISLFDNGYIKVRSLDERILTCMVDIEVANKLNDNKELYTEKGSKVSIKNVSKIVEQNQVKIVLFIEDIEYLYGQMVENLKLFTGKVYEDVLALDESCVYQKDETGSYYVRVLDDYGYFIEEKEVMVGFKNNDMVTVLNLDEGTLCDSGYKNLLLYDEE